MPLLFPADAPVANPLFYRSYSRRLDGTRESLEQVIDRNLDGLTRLGRLTPEQVKVLRRHQVNLTALPSGRWLWVGGTPWIERPENYSGGYNCTSTEVNDWRAFGLMMALAMMGSGTGAVLEERNISQLPSIRNELVVRIVDAIGSVAAADRQERTTTRQHGDSFFTIKVGDSRQGWVEAYTQLLYLASDPLLAETIVVDVEVGSVRPPGEPLAGFGGVANPIQLPQLFTRVAGILSTARGRKLTALECCLLIDEAAKTVVAGNIRRSAGMRQFAENDIDAADAKLSLWTQAEDGSWMIDSERDALRMANHTRVFHHKPSYEEVLASVSKQYHCGEGAIQYAPAAIVRANDDLLELPWVRKDFLRAYEAGGRDAAASILALLAFGESERDQLTEEQQRELNHRMSRYGLNPCAEILGSDFHCNLSEVHLNRLNPFRPAEVDEAFQAAAITVATLLRQNFREERHRYSRDLDPIVGVSFTGLFDYFVKLFGVPWLEWWTEGRPPHDRGQEFAAEEGRHLTRFRRVVEAAVKAYCEEHGLKTPNRCTTVQPAGSKSLLTNASPGWHPPKAARYIRRVTFGREDPIALACMDYGYTVVPSQSDKDEQGRLLDDPFDPRCTEWLVEIPVQMDWANLPGADAIDISQFSALAQFDFYMAVQRFYTRHNTSATIEFRESEIEPLARAIHAAIEADQPYISAALLARFDSKETFPRLPYEPIDKATYHRLHNDVLARRGDTVFSEALAARDQATTLPEEPAGPAGCDSDACTLPLAAPQSVPV